MIKNIIFDMDGVIRDLINTPIIDLLNEEKKIKYCKKYEGIGICDFHNKYREMECFIKWDIGLIDKEDIINAVVLRDEDPKEIISVVYNAIISKSHNMIFTETIELIKNLKEEGKKAFILSNMSKDVVGVLENMIDFEMFDGVIFSCDEGIKKPDISLYELAIKRWGIDPQESLFVDDRMKNLEPFESLGGNVCLFNTNNIDKSIENLTKKINIC